VLDLAKIEAGRITLDPRPFDVVGLVDEVTSSVQPLVDRNGNALTVDISQALPLVELDRTRTGQILLNLLSNAAKFTKHGRIDLRVFAESDPHDDWIVFEVKDSGIGIPPKKLDVIFEAFGQADSSTTREFGGTGLGLTITRQFCEMMRGTIAVASTVGSRLDLRRAPAHPHSSSRADGSTAPAEERVMKILVVEDNVFNRDLIQRFLEPEGFEVVVAHDGAEGLARAVSDRPDLVLMDMSLPVVDGWEATRRMKADPATAAIPVIALTAHAMLGDREKALQAGCDDYDTKPIDIERLLSKIRALLPARQGA
jgi:CheY-like chemotaxis protein